MPTVLHTFFRGFEVIIEKQMESIINEFEVLLTNLSKKSMIYDSPIFGRVL